MRQPAVCVSPRRMAEMIAVQRSAVDIGGTASEQNAERYSRDRVNGCPQRSERS
jgi:hypothetical protein